MKLIKYIEEIKTKRPKIVDLTKYELEEIPNEIFEFDWIEKLILGNFYNNYTREIEGSSPCKLNELPEELARLKNLKSLSISGGLFIKPKPAYRNFHLLGKLVSLEELYMNTTHLNTLQFLKPLKKLKRLQIAYTEIKDYSDLKNYNQLISLSIGVNRIYNIDFLSEFSDLEVLSLSSNKMTSLAPIRNCTKLKKLCVCNTKIEDYDALKQLKQLQSFCNGHYDDIEILSENVNLKKFKTESIDQKGINKLKNFQNLQKVELLNFIGDELDISCFNTVKELYVKGEFHTIKGFEQLKEVRSLHISSKNLKSLKIPYLENLHKLAIPECPVTNFEFYPNFDKITELYIQHTQISSLSPIANLTLLTRLDCSNTKIKSIRPILNKLITGISLEFYTKYIPSKLIEVSEEDGYRGILDYYEEHGME